MEAQMRKIIKLIILAAFSTFFVFICVGLSACNSHSHTLNYIEYIEATCQHEGRLESWYCSGCDKYFLDEKGLIETESIFIPQTDHIYENYNCKFCEITDIQCFNISIIDGEAMIMGLKDEHPTKIIIPNTITDNYIEYPITTIFSSAFNDELFLTNCILPNSLTCIGDSAFYGCRMLQSIEIPRNVRNIGHTAFANCICLTTVRFENESHLETIGEFAFSGCKSLVGISLPFGVQTIPTALFMNCSQLAFVDVPIALTQISDSAFINCETLTSILIPETVVTIGNNAFMNCHLLSKITFEAVNCNDFDIDNNIFYAAGTLGGGITIGVGSATKRIPNYFCYSSGTNSSMPYIRDIQFDDNSNCKSIGEYAFYNCKVLKSIHLPDSIVEIGDYAFYCCSALSEFSFDGSSEMNEIATGAFMGCSNIENVAIPSHVTRLSDCAFSDCSSLETVSIPETLEYIGKSCFSDCASLVEIFIPAAVKEMSDDAFLRCRKLQTVDIEVGSLLSSLPEMAFAGCESLEQIHIPNGVESLGWGIFYGCTSLRILYIPESLKEISSTAFTYCDALESVHITNLLAYCDIKYGNLESYPLHYADKLFLNDKPLSEVVIPATITEIPVTMFSGCSTLKKVVIPPTVSKIDKGAFGGCGSIEEITIPFIGEEMTEKASYSSLFGYIFGDINYQNSTAITQYYNFPYGECCYYIPSKLSKVNIIAGEILYGSFYGCSMINSITIGENVTKIGERAFSLLTNLEEINYNCISCSDLLPNNQAFTHAGADTKGLVIRIGRKVKKIPAHLFAPYDSILDDSVRQSPNIVAIEFELDSSCEYIGEYAFFDSRSLTTLFLPKTLNSVGQYAFYNCNKIDFIHYNSTKEMWSLIDIGEGNTVLLQAQLNYV